ncbi:hypothetical protein QSV08_03270 [Maribacter sp. BPC-D8]|uniref:hypothetical protein n=1 Tax=Maribacter sp. BPC-D8 TaxID=3053613 RepID=UPI002B48BB46|nr:hypothetical protein [Maribacter sp. BPC-D8]WRI30264.1 hypothetical protein QSV08_03270 [Maribacter sp. BPC-D8]
MNFIEKLFSKNKIDCPRCLGKGEVDWNDIKRLNKELKWGPGKCAYCNGSGKIKSNFESKVSVDTTYLTSDLNKKERNRVINKDEKALLRGILFEKNADNFIKQVKYLNKKGNLTKEEITEFYLIPENEMSNEEKDELMDYIKRIIEFDKNQT